VQDHAYAGEDDQWVEQDRAGQVASDVVRGEPCEDNPKPGWNGRVLDVFL